MKKQCDECGKEFDVDVTKRNWQHKKLCSDDCQKAHTNKIARLKYTPIQWPQRKICLHCSSEFLVHKDGNLAQKYCGKECQLSAKNKIRIDAVASRRKTKLCEHCGTEFVADKYAAHKQRFCSNECRSKSRNKQQYLSGASRSQIRNAHRYDFKQIRPQVLERDGNKCTICGSTEKLHAHHWDNTGGTEQANNDLSNLTTMCDVCHYAIHNITLVHIGGEWKLDGKIFELLGLKGRISIRSEFEEKHAAQCARLNEKLAKGRKELGIKTLEDFAKIKK